MPPVATPPPCPPRLLTSIQECAVSDCPWLLLTIQWDCVANFKFATVAACSLQQWQMLPIQAFPLESRLVNIHQHTAAPIPGKPVCLDWLRDDLDFKGQGHLWENTEGKADSHHPLPLSHPQCTLCSSGPCELIIKCLLMLFQGWPGLKCYPSKWALWEAGDKKRTERPLWEEQGQPTPKFFPLSYLRGLLLHSGSEPWGCCHGTSPASLAHRDKYPSYFGGPLEKHKSLWHSDEEPRLRRQNAWVWISMNQLCVLGQVI